MALVTVDQLREVLDVPATIVPDASLQSICDSVEAIILPLLVELDPPATYDDDSAVCEAALGMGVQIWQSRQAPGGQMVGVDLNPQSTPHLLGPGLIMRFQGLLAHAMPYGGSVIA